MLESRGYAGSVERDDEAAVLFDVIPFQGHTIEEVTRAFRDSVDGYLKFCVERGERPADGLPP